MSTQPLREMSARNFAWVKAAGAQGSLENMGASTSQNPIIGLASPPQEAAFNVKRNIPSFSEA
jgi:hypothetical protein